MPVDGKPGERPRGELTPEERAELERRSSELGRKLGEARQTGNGRKPGASARDRGEAMSRALRLSSELIGGIVVGGAIGWYLDGVLGNSKPYLFILFFLLGAAAGMVNVIRTAMRENSPSKPTDDGRQDKGN